MIENKEMLLYSAQKAVKHISKVGAENADDKECFFINCLKHNITFTKAYKAKGHDYPYDFPYDYGTHFIWTSLDEVNVWESKENQRMNYKNNFEGKNVFITMSEIMNEIEKYYEIL